MLRQARRHVYRTIEPATSKRRLWTSHLSSPVQSYLSTSTDAAVNLSLEHYLLQTTAPSSVVLLFYTNSPTIVLGRNQNPWLESNLAHILPRLRSHDLALIRRRSGGGTVVHDSGNINWTAIVPPARFNRNTHAELVVRALRAAGVPRARVNARHDIVLDQGAAATGHADPEDTHATSYTAPALPPLKCSGSAFKLTRTRALHHGTCLLQSAQLAQIGQLLRSPGRGFIDALGVASVSSPVGNAGVSHAAFVAGVRAQFAQMYAPAGLEHVQVGEEEAVQVDAVARGVAELRGAAWTYGQTPRFGLRGRAGQVAELRGLAPLSVGVDVEKGRVRRLAVARDEHEDALTGPALDETIYHDPVPLYEGGWDWNAQLAQVRSLDASEREALVGWIQRVLPAI